MSVYQGLSESQQFACKVIADHARATTFAIGDGILPGNEGRNYVLRKIMRRAIYHGREHLGIKEPFFFKVCDFVVDQMQGAYPELAVQREFIGKRVRLEEERFGNTMTVGLRKLHELLGENQSASSQETIVDAGKLAELYDTFGTPIDLMYVILSQEDNLKLRYLQEYDDPTWGPSHYNIVQFDQLDEEKFRSGIENVLKRLQKKGAMEQKKQNDKINPVYVAVERTSIRSKFHGYDATKLDESEVIALVRDDKRVEEVVSGDEGLVVLKDTPFYAESGGQVGDSGILFNSDAQLKVQDTFAPISGIILHKSKVESGSLKVGDKVTAVVDSFKRDATRRNHTATHLLHAALKEVLGTHVKQAGSVVAPNYLRFDFAHYQPMSDAEIQVVEDLVNRYILQNHTVTTNLMAIEEAMRSGAVAMFGEKYGSEVRVLSVGDGKFSMELCGGTHVRATGDIGSFKITSDEAIASGVRRIRAITGFDALTRFREDERLIDRSLEALKTQRDNLPNAIERLQEEVKRTRKEIEELKLKIATGAANGASSNEDEAREIAGVKVLAKVVDGLDANGQRQLSDTLLARLKSGVVVLGRKDEGKASIIVRVSDDLKDRVKAGNVIKEIVPIIGGKGGGRPDMAEGGGPDADKLYEAIEAGYKVIETFLSP